MNNDNTSNIILENKSKININLSDLLKKNFPNNTIIDAKNPIKEKLFDRIKKDKKLAGDTLFIISAEYERIYKKYNALSLSIMIISALATFLEAFRLLFSNYLESNNYDTITFTLIVNIFVLSMGTIITINSSIIRFRNYREIMEKLKNNQQTLMKYKLLYDKQIDYIENYDIINELNDKTGKIFRERLEEFSKDIKEINIFDNLKNSDINKISKKRAEFDIERDKIINYTAIEKINNEKQLEIDKFKTEKKTELEKIKIICDNELEKIKITSNTSNILHYLILT